MRAGFQVGWQAGRKAGFSPHEQAFYVVRTLSASRPIFTADYYIIDPISGKVYAFVDWNDPTHWLVQADPAKQVAIPHPHADFGGKLCANFTGVEWYQSNRPAAYWRPWHDGTGVDGCAVHTPTSVAVGVRVLYSTRLTVSGISVYQSAGAMNVIGSLAAGTTFLNMTGQAVSVNVPILSQFSHALSDTPDARHKSTGVAAASSNYSSPPETGIGAQAPLMLGGFSTSTLLYIGRFAVLHFAPILSPYVRDQRNDLLTALYKVTA